MSATARSPSHRCNKTPESGDSCQTFRSSPALLKSKAKIFRDIDFNFRCLATKQHKIFVPFFVAKNAVGGRRSDHP